MNHQNNYLQPAVKNVWKREQNLLFDEMKKSGDNSINAAADGRADSPGHSAKYGSYTLLNTDTNKVIHMELVTV